MRRYALVKDGAVERVALSKPHPSALPVEFPTLQVTGETHHIDINPAQEWEVHSDKVVVTYTITERDFAAEEAERERKLQEWRRDAVVSRLQARVVLRENGLRDQVDAFMESPEADPLAVDAWRDAQEFRRMSPTIQLLGDALGLDDDDIDQLFEQAALVEA